VLVVADASTVRIANNQVATVLAVDLNVVDRVVGVERLRLPTRDELLAGITPVNRAERRKQAALHRSRRL